MATIRIRNLRDLIAARRVCRRISQELCFPPVEAARIVAALSEMAEAIREDVREGILDVSVLETEGRCGLVLMIRGIEPFLPRLFDAMQRQESGRIGRFANIIAIADDFGVIRLADGTSAVRLLKWKTRE